MSSNFDEEKYPRLNCITFYASTLYRTHKYFDEETVYTVDAVIETEKGQLTRRRTCKTSYSKAMEFMKGVLNELGS